MRSWISFILALVKTVVVFPGARITEEPKTGIFDADMYEEYI
jgi:hypothetical protein